MTVKHQASTRKTVEVKRAESCMAILPSPLPRVFHTDLLILPYVFYLPLHFLVPLSVPLVSIHPGSSSYPPLPLPLYHPLHSNLSFAAALSVLRGSRASTSQTGWKNTSGLPST